MITSFVETFGLCRLGPRTGNQQDPQHHHEHQQQQQEDGFGSAGPVEIDVQAYLEVVGIPVTSREDDTHDHTVSSSSCSSSQKISLNHDEALKKVGLVHKALVCLGDLERYKEQYGVERDKQFGQSGRQGRRKGGPGDAQGQGRVVDPAVGSAETGETYLKAKSYYEVARGLLPDNGQSQTSF